MIRIQEADGELVPRVVVASKLLPALPSTTTYHVGLGRNNQSPPSKETREQNEREMARVLLQEDRSTMDPEGPYGKPE